MKGIIFCLFFALILSTVSYGQTEWTMHPTNPVLVTETQTWEDDFIAPGSVIKQNGQYHMWYTGGKFPVIGGDLKFGYATSEDGVHWKRYAENPIMGGSTQGVWDEKGVLKPTVLYIDSLFHMWYSGYASDNQFNSIGHATSKDGINWIRDPKNPVVESDDLGSILAPTVIYDGSQFHMYYAVHITSSIVEIGHATSQDGESWMKDPKNPVLNVGTSGNWDYPELNYPNAYFDGSKYHIWFNAGELLNWDKGYASSDDGFVWTKYSKPVIERGTSDSWNDEYISMMAVWQAEGTPGVLHMLYHARASDNTAAIGYATSDLVDAVEDNKINIIPGEVSLLQNYPNPFNPSTTIEFTLPKSEYVELKVFNILGSEVTTIESKKLTQGTHTYTFDGKNLASGVYYYKLVAENFMQTRKMIYLK